MNTDIKIDIQYLFSDRSVQKGTPVARFDPLIFKVNGDTIYGQILVPDGNYKGLHPCVIFFHGFAGFISFDDIAQALCRIGCVVVIPKHRGAWGSEGEYSITNCIEDAVTLAEYCRSEEFFNTYQTAPDAVFLTGQSMGGNTTVNAAKRLKWLRGIMPLVPCDIAAIDMAFSEEEMAKFLVENGAEVLNVESTAALCKNIRENRSSMLFTNGVEQLKNTNIFIATAELDEIVQVNETVEELLDVLEKSDGKAYRRHVSYYCEHNLMGVRTRLALDMATFMKECLES